MTQTLRDMIATESARPTFAAAHFFAQHLAESFGPSVAAVLFYGSCLRQATDEGLLLDFYVLVDRMGDAIKNPISAAAGAVLSPNVYYRETQFEGRTLRAKVAVMTMARFLRDTSSDCFASSIWARFSQAALVLNARTPVIQARVQDGLTQAIDTMARNTLPLMSATFTARDLWVQALTCTYGAELRPESASKAAELVNADLARYETVTEALFGPSVSGAFTNTATDQRAKAERAWYWRRVQGKILNVLRLIKAAFTFQGGLDYAVWKIERHSGVKMDLTDAERRHPVLTGLKLLPRLMKKGGLK
ncbi:MAG: hypothetical protein JNM81_12345 [Rhodospirillaceae bacterium]|nr:hypothetical protein [Rhodospirillaceae bacterium]